MIKVPISNRSNPNLFFLADDEYKNELIQYRWYITPRGYAFRDENGTFVYAHRQITRAIKGFIIDHINHNKLDNRRSNLHVVTSRQNSQNRLPRKNCTSVYKGVSWNKKINAWVARIHINGNSKFLGVYESEVKAAQSYDEAAAKYFGKYSHVNNL